MGPLSYIEMLFFSGQLINAAIVKIWEFSVYRIPSQEDGWQFQNVY